jgi:hypothetical protein
MFETTNQICGFISGQGHPSLRPIFKQTSQVCAFVDPHPCVPIWVHWKPAIYINIKKKYVVQTCIFI